MRTILGIHILAGALALVAGYTALAAAKGATLHRRSGMLFVVAMLTMSLGGLVVTIAGDIALGTNVPAALLTAYLVVTSVTTVKPLPSGGRWLDVAAMLVALVVGTTSLVFGFEAVANGGTRNGMPAFPFFLFGVVGVLGAGLDLRMVRAGGLRGASRLARHLWRMCFALLIAALSFFIGQQDVFPRALRIPPLLALPVLVVLVTMIYWLWRVRARRSLPVTLKTAPAFAEASSESARRSARPITASPTSLRRG
jgi:uncharacterized membrane protein